MITEQEWKFHNIIEFINDNPNVNMIAIGMTYLHANFIDASIIKLKEQGISLNGCILMQAHGITGRILKKEDFITNDMHICFANYNHSDADSRPLIYRQLETFTISKTIKNRTKKKRRVYILRACFEAQLYSLFVNSCPDVQFIFIEIEDGAGSYENRYKHIKRSYSKSENMFLTSIKAHINYYNNVKILKTLNSEGMYIKHTMFLKDNDEETFRRNEDIISCYLDVISKQSKNSNGSCGLDFNNTILINTQPLEENHITDGIVDVEVYQDVISELKSIGYDVVIKPHPRETSLDKYLKKGWKLIKQNTSQEAMLIECKHKPICIISIYSSTLLNAYGLFDIKPISLAKLLIKKDISGKLLDQLNEHISTYQGIIFFPDSVDELIREIKSYK